MSQLDLFSFDDLIQPEKQTEQKVEKSFYIDDYSYVNYLFYGFENPYGMARKEKDESKILKRLERFFSERDSLEIIDTVKKSDERFVFRLDYYIF